jgi:hypothetical protein
VAGGAAIPRRRMLPQEGSALVGVAGRALLGDRIPLPQQPDVRGSVRVVAGRAFHLAFADRHVPRAIQLGHLVAMACHTETHLRRCFELRLLGLEAVDAVARDAGEVPGIVDAPLPERVRLPVVARHADRARLAIDGSSAWTDAGPWQVSHPRLDAGDRA